MGACSSTGSLYCETGPTHGLDPDLPESSGAAWSLRSPDVFWTVNDGPGGELFAVSLEGETRARVATTGPRLLDVEALASGPCGETSCLYMADTGDNQERRDRVVLYRLEEPDPADPAPGPVLRTAFPVRFPSGPEDVEALAVLPGERLVLVGKGRNRPSGVYRYPGPLTPDSLVMLEPLAPLQGSTPSFTGRITGAGAVPGSAPRVLVRSYEALALYRLTDGGLEPLPDGRLSLRSLLEPQGEAVAVREDGTVVLTSEEGPLASGAEMRILRCRFSGSGDPGTAGNPVDGEAR